MSLVEQKLKRSPAQAAPAVPRLALLAALRAPNNIHTREEEEDVQTDERASARRLLTLVGSRVGVEFLRPVETDRQTDNRRESPPTLTLSM